MSRSGAKISVEAVSRHYETEAGLVRAVDGISLVVQPGEAVAIMGPSGCGKSTLLGLIGGLELPTDGRIAVGGREVSALGDAERTALRRAELGFVFHAGDLLPFLTAVENVALGLALDDGEGAYRTALAVLTRLGLGADSEKLGDQLSGGQRQRVAVARAVVRRPRLILADEPTGSLDGASSAVVIDSLLDARREAGSTLLVATHDPAVARRLDRTLTLCDGKLAGVELSAGEPNA